MIDVKAITLSAARATFASPATITPPGAASISGHAIGPDQRGFDFPSAGGRTVAELRTVIDLFRDEVSEIPAGTVVVIAGTTFTVDGIVAEADGIVTVAVR